MSHCSDYCLLREFVSPDAERRLERAGHERDHELAAEPECEHVVRVRPGLFGLAHHHLQRGHCNRRRLEFHLGLMHPYALDLMACLIYY